MSENDTRDTEDAAGGGGERDEAFAVANRPDPGDLARMVVDPAFNAVLAVQSVIPPVGAALDVNALADELEAQCRAASAGNLARHEALLTAHAHTLDALFTQLVWRAAVGAEHALPRTEAYLRLALKAQAQCRATVEALAAMKRPPLVIAQQANVANGPQQVNNNLVVRENPGEQNKLLEQGGDERLDPGAAQEAGGGDLAVASVGAVDRAEDS